MAFYILAGLLCTFTEVIVASSPPRQVRDQVLSINPQSDEEIQFVKQICSQYQAVFWQPSSIDDIRLNKEIHLYVNASNIEEVKNQLATATIIQRVLIEDVQQLIKKQKHTNEALRPRGLFSYYERYHPLEEITVQGTNWLHYSTYCTPLSKPIDE